jgi:hypothetical protein
VRINADSESNDLYKAGYAKRLENHYLNRYGWDALLFADTRDFCRSLPNVFSVDGEHFDFVLVIPITKAEYRVWHQSGYRGLLQQVTTLSRRLRQQRVNHLTSPESLQPQQSGQTGHLSIVTAQTNNQR